MHDIEHLIIPHLEREEGFRPYAYQDHMGYWTIGIGRLIDKEKGGGITREEAEYLLSHDVRRFYNLVMAHIPWAKGLDHVRKCVLVAMAFQMGIDGLLNFKNTLKYVREERWGQAAAGMRSSLWARQTPARANRLAKAMETGEARWLIGD